MMKRILITAFTAVMFCASALAFTIKNPQGRFELGAGMSLGAVGGYNVIEVRAAYNTNENLYVGFSYLNGSGYYYQSASNTAKNWILSFHDIGLVLGAQTAAFSERFTMFFNAIPAFTFGERASAAAHTPLLESNNNTFGNGQNAVASGPYEEQVYFAPAVEIGFNCHLTDNVIVSAGWLAKYVKVSDMSWKQSPAFIKLGEEDAFIFSLPVRLTVRF